MSYLYEREELNEASLQRIKANVENRPIAMLTAFRGRDADGNPMDRKTNRANNARLENDIRAAGFGFNKLIGTYDEDDGKGGKRRVEEESFLIIGRSDPETIGRSETTVAVLKGFVKKMGRKYGQDCVLFKDPKSKNAVLIGTKADAWPGLNKEESVGEFKPMAMSGIYSKMVRGKERAPRGFKFEAIEYPRTVTEIWAKKMQEKLKYE